MNYFIQTMSTSSARAIGNYEYHHRLHDTSLIMEKKNKLKSTIKRKSEEIVRMPYGFVYLLNAHCQ